MKKIKILILFSSLILCFKFGLATEKTQKEDLFFKKNEEYIIKENTKKNEKENKKEQPKKNPDVFSNEEEIDFFDYNGIFTFF